MSNKTHEIASLPESERAFNLSPFGVAALTTILQSKHAVTPAVAITPNVNANSINGKNRALLIGINYYGTSSQLNGCINDIKSIKAFLINEQGLTESDIKILADDPTPLGGNVPIKPTRINILDGIRWLVSKTNADSRLFIHYSGHGTSLRDQGVKDEADGFDEAICPCDYDSAGFISDDELKTHLVDPLPAGSQVFGIFDCCHSGTILDLKYNYLYKPGVLKDTFELQVEKLESVSKGKAILLSGCLDNQTSADAFINNKSQGAMTYAFLEGFKKIKEEKVPVSCQSLLKNLTDFIKRGGYTQVPKLSTGTAMSIEEPLKFF